MNYSVTTDVVMIDLLLGLKIYLVWHPDFIAWENLSGMLYAKQSVDSKDLKAKISAVLQEVIPEVLNDTQENLTCYGQFHYLPRGAGMLNRNNLCRIWDAHSSGYEEYIICDVTPFSPLKAKMEAMFPLRSQLAFINLHGVVSQKIVISN